MTLSFSSYVEPGVYVDAGAAPTVIAPGVAPTVVCLIGNGIGYHTFTETVSFASSASAVLSQKGIDPTSIVVTGYITDPNAAGNSIPHTFIPDAGSTTHDYSVATDTSGGADNSVTTITKSSGSAIESGYPQVTVSYRYTDADYHSLHFFADFTSLIETYGQPLNPTTGAVASPLSLAAQVAMQNGATQLYTIALNPAAGTTAQQYAAAYQTLSGSNHDANVVVPLWDGITSGSALAGMLATLNAALLADANNNAVLRVAIVGFDSAYAGSPTDVATLATGIGSPRIVAAWPNQLNFFNGVTNKTVVVDGIYLAAAMAGRLVAQAPQVPLTHKTIQGFSGVPATVAATLTKTNKDILAVGGVTVCQLDRNGRLQVRQGLTTNYAGGVLKRELSLVRAQDALYTLLQTTIANSELIGEPIGPTSAMQIKSITAGALETAKQFGTIADYNSLAVREQAPPNGDPTIIEVQFAYKPSWPLNYILVNFTVDTTTGDTTTTAA